jgi:hypothetical protein
MKVASQEEVNKWVADNNKLALLLYNDIYLLTDNEIYIRYDKLMNHYKSQPNGHFVILDYFGLSSKLEERFKDDPTWGGRRMVFKIDLGNKMSDGEIKEYLEKIKRKMRK